MSKGFHTEALVAVYAEHIASTAPLNVVRRLIKMQEELGELAEAWLCVTGGPNYKKKTLSDVREEMVDCYVVATDALLVYLRASCSPAVAKQLFDKLQESVPADDEALSLPFETTLALAAGLVAGALQQAVCRQDAAPKLDASFHGALLSMQRLFAQWMVSPLVTAATSEPGRLEDIRKILTGKLQKWKDIRAGAFRATTQPDVADYLRWIKDEQVADELLTEALDEWVTDQVVAAGLSKVNAADARDAQEGAISDAESRGAEINNGGLSAQISFLAAEFPDWREFARRLKEELGLKTWPFPAPAI